MSGWNHDGCQLVQSQNREPELVTAFQHQHHAVTLFHAQLLEIGSSLVGIFFKLAKGKTNLRTLVIGPQQGQLVGVCGCPFVHHIISKVEMFWYDKVEILYKIFL